MPPATHSIQRGGFKIYQDRITEEAFLSIGQEATNKAVLIVEDALAKEIIETVINKEFPPEFSQVVQVRYLPGGVTRMKNDAVLYSQETNVKRFIIFDGTENTGEALDPGTIAPNELTLQNLKSAIKSATKQEIDFPSDGGSHGGRPDQQLQAMQAYLGFWHQRVRFLPFNVPEEEIWNAELVHEELKDVIAEKSEIALKEAQINDLEPKDRFALLVELVYGRNRSENIMTVQSKFVRNWIKRRPNSLQPVIDMLAEIRRSL